MENIPSKSTFSLWTLRASHDYLILNGSSRDWLSPIKPKPSPWSSPKKPSPSSCKSIYWNPHHEYLISKICQVIGLDFATTMVPRDGSQDRIGTPDAVERGIATIHTLRWVWTRDKFTPLPITEVRDIGRVTDDTFRIGVKAFVNKVSRIFVCYHLCPRHISSFVTLDMSCEYPRNLSVLESALRRREHFQGLISLRRHALPWGLVLAMHFLRSRLFWYRTV